jgi:hypothetical protein
MAEKRCGVGGGGNGGLVEEFEIGGPAGVEVLATELVATVVEKCCVPDGVQ